MYLSCAKFVHSREVGDIFVIGVNLSLELSP
jgi:hypothetical protein